MKKENKIKSIVLYLYKFRIRNADTEVSNIAKEIGNSVMNASRPYFNRRS